MSLTLKHPFCGKTILTILFLIINLRVHAEIKPISMCLAEDSSQQRTSLLLRTGIKLSESLEYPGTKGGLFIDAGLNFLVGNHWTIRPGFTFWSAESKINEDIFNAFGIDILFDYLVEIGDFSLLIGAGPGLFRVNDSYGYRPGLLLETGINYPIDDLYTVNFTGQYQHIAPMDPGGSGKGYNPLILAIGVYMHLY